MSGPAERSRSNVLGARCLCFCMAGAKQCEQPGQAQQVFRLGVCFLLQGLFPFAWLVQGAVSILAERSRCIGLCAWFFVAID